MSSSLSELTLPELTSPELTSSELASPKFAWSELPFPELPAYIFGHSEFNPMSSSLLETALPESASPISAWSARPVDHLAWWQAAIWECLPYTNIPRLPPELTDRIIDFVNGIIDLFTTKQGILYNCALVCHAWYPASHYHLCASRLALKSSKCFEALVQTSRTPHVAAALQSVLVLDLNDSKPAWVHRFPLVLGQMFSAVQALHIHDLEWGKVVIHPRTLLISFRQFGCVTKMELSYCRFHNFSQFRHLICALPWLQTLSMLYSRLERCETFPIAHVASPFPACTCLVVKTGDDETQLALSSALFRWLTLMPASIHRLQRLEILLDHQILSPLRNFLMHAGTSLEDLQLHLVDGTTASDVQDLNIGQCTALCNLVLQSVRGVSLAEILRIISPNCHLHTLSIMMEPGEVDCEWESAARILEQQFLILREFRLDVSGGKIAEEEKRRISDCLNALRRRGVKVTLTFDHQWAERLKPYHSDSFTVSACQSKTPELQVEDGRPSGVILTSNDDGHQSSI